MSDGIIMLQSDDDRRWTMDDDDRLVGGIDSTKTRKGLLKGVTGQRLVITKSSTNKEYLLGGRCHRVVDRVVPKEGQATIHDF